MQRNCFRAIAALPVPMFPRVGSQPLVLTPPLPQCEVCVIVPVRNEADILQSTLLALAYQVERDGCPLDLTRYEIILFANNCSDRSAEIARQFASDHPHLVLHIVERILPPDEAYIGRVRQLLMDEACQRLMSLGRKRGMIASTDGDTQVAADWIAATLQEIAAGADAVGGRIITDRVDRLALAPYARACHLREVGYRFLVAELESYLDPDPFDPMPRHYQHYGASFAVTAESYQQAGGLPPVRTPEDVALYQALLRVNVRFRHSTQVRVTTSARQIGRACNGLANQLSEWTAMGQRQQAFLVESAIAITTRFQARHELRKLWQKMLEGTKLTALDAALTANKLGIATQWLYHELKRSPSFWALFEQVEQRQKEEGIWQQRWSLVKIEQAIADLRFTVEQLRQKQLCCERQLIFDKTLTDKIIPNKPYQSLQLSAKPVQIGQDDIVLLDDLLDAAV